MAKNTMGTKLPIMPDDINRKIVSLCKELNAGIGLPETVFKFPLHISLKKSFRTHNFEAVRGGMR